VAPFFWSGIALTLVYFFGLLRIFRAGSVSLAEWCWAAWNPLNHQEHSRLVLPIACALLWWERRRTAQIPRSPSSLGLLPFCLGIAAFLVAVRTAQPRLGIVALPLLFWGATWFLWGAAVVRACRFPFAFLLLMVPVGNYVQGTVSLQLLVTGACNLLAPLIGLHVEATGTTIRSLDGGFHFEIAEGCSGIRSLMSMVSVTALYVHFAQPVTWKKVAVFTGSLVFAVVGNIGRIFSVLLVARFAGPKWAGGLYHDYSDLIFFPVAVAAMMGFNRWISRDWSRLAPRPQPIQSAVQDREDRYDY
jgi:exosortase